MESERYKGRSIGLKGESKWLAAEDILGLGDVRVQIEAVFFRKNIEFEAGRKANKGTIKFVGKVKELVLNNTNRKTLVGLFGVDTDDWEGRWVALYTVKCKLKGQEVDGIRIKATKPPQQKKDAE